MVEWGVQPNVYIYSALINACAKACDVKAACAWLDKAESSGSTLDGVVYGCVINACGKAGDTDGAMKAFQQMRNHGIRTHVVIYGALARPFAYKGDYEQVEKIAADMAGEGIPLNDYFLYMILLAYSRSKPKKSQLAEEAFCKAVSSGIQINERVLKALSSAVGRARCAQLQEHYVRLGAIKPGLMAS
jgi:pentatricopeptide repeat domain-containing protein 1